MEPWFNVDAQAFNKFTAKYSAEHASLASDQVRDCVELAGRAEAWLGDKSRSVDIASSRIRAYFRMYTVLLQRIERITLKSSAPGSGTDNR